ncbi:hypothetical protein CRG98_021228, partial [Punica granatum]
VYLVPLDPGDSPALDPRVVNSPNPQVTLITGANIPNHRPRGPTPPCTPSTRNPSAKWGLASSHHSTPGNVYVEDDLDRVCESWLDITWELERSNGYRENRSTFASLVGSIGPDPRLPKPSLP